MAKEELNQEKSGILKQYAGDGYKNILFIVEQKFNKQNDCIYAKSRKEILDVWKKYQDPEASFTDGLMWKSVGMESWNCTLYTARNESESKELHERNTRTDCKSTEHWSFQPFQPVLQPRLCSMI